MSLIADSLLCHAMHGRDAAMSAFPGLPALVAYIVLAAGAAAAADGLLFRASFDESIHADFSAAQASDGQAATHEPSLVEGKMGKAMDIARGGHVAYQRAGHIQELEGTVSFYFKTKFPGNENRGMWRIFFEVDPNHMQFYKSKDGSALRVAYKNFDYKPDAVQADIAHIRPGEWHHVALCWAKSRIALYLDGELAEAKDTGGLVPFKSSVIKANANGDIVIDELRIHDRAVEPVGDPFWVREHQTFDLPEWTPRAVRVELSADDPMAGVADEHLIYYAPFDEGTDAVSAAGDRHIEVPAGARLIKGRYGGALDSGNLPFRFKWRDNLDPKQGTLSFWFFSRFSPHMPRPHRPVLFSVGGVNFEIAYWAGMFCMIARDGATGNYTWAWQAASDGTLRHNQWNHVAAQWQDGKFRLRLNGKLSAMRRYPSLAAPDFPYATLNAGQCAVIDEVRIYDKAVLPWLFGPIPFSTEAATPHFKWATPWAAPRTRALVLTDARFPVELAQRADLDVDTVNTSIAPYLHMEDYRGGKWAGADIGGWIEKKIEEDPWDVLVLGPRGAKYVNRHCADMIIGRVEAGAGLVLINAGAAPDALAGFAPLKQSAEATSEERPIDRRSDHFIAGAFDLSGAFTQGLRAAGAADEAVAFAGDTPAIAVRAAGKGRVVGFAWESPVPTVSRYLKGEIRPDAPDRNPDYPTFDFREDYYAVTIRAILWAARREPAVRIRSLVVTGDELLLTTVNNAETIRAEADVCVQDEYAQVVHAARHAVTAAEASSETRLPLPVRRLPGGRNRVIVRLLAGDKVLDFGQAMLVVPKPVTVADVALQKYVFDRDETVAVQAAFEGRTASALAVCRLFDGRDRLLAATDAPIADGKAAFQFGASRLVHTVTARVEVDAILAGVRSDRAVQEFFVPRPAKLEDYTFTTYWVGPYSINWEQEAGRLAIGARMRMMLTYGLPTNTASAPTICEPQYLRPFVDAGIAVAPQGMLPAEVRLHHDRERSEWMNRLLHKAPAERTKEDLVRLVCYNDPAFREKVRVFSEKSGRAFRKYGPIAYNLQDEMNYMRGKEFGADAPDCCFCEHCMQRMRTWLAAEYGTLDALNAAWAASFADWAAVEPDTFLEAQAKRRYASWADHRRFNDISTRDLLALAKESIRDEDPDASTQLSGTYDTTVYSGMDWWELYKTLDSSNGYSDRADRGSLQGTLATQWSSAHTNVPWTSGYNLAPHLQRYGVFARALDGDMGSAWWWSRMLWREDYASHAWGKAAMAAAKVMHDGLARLTRTAVGNPERIAIHYSMASHRLNYALTGGTEKHFRYGRAGWAWLLKECGLSFELVAASQVEAGHLVERRFKVFIMPSSMAMSDEEIVAVREFVAAGGAVFADYAPAIADQRLVPRAESALGDLFGIDRIGKGLRFDRGRIQMGLPVVEQGITPWRVRTFGRGRAVFVNLDLSDYLRDEGTFRCLRNRQGSGAALKGKLMTVLADAGIRPSHTIRTVDGRMVSRCSSRSWRDGSALYLGFIKMGDPPRAIYDETSGIFVGYEDIKGDPSRRLDFAVAFEPAGHIYNSRSGEYLGRRQSIDVTIPEHDLAFFSVLPYRVDTLHVSAPAQVAQGRVLTFSVSIEADSPAAAHVVRMEWFDPDGRYLDYYSKNYVTSGGRADITIATALNEQVGAHRLAFRDAATGTTRDLTLAIVPYAGR